MAKNKNFSENIPGFDMDEEELSQIGQSAKPTNDKAEGEGRGSDNEPIEFDYGNMSIDTIKQILKANEGKEVLKGKYVNIPVPEGIGSLLKNLCGYSGLTQSKLNSALILMLAKASEEGFNKYLKNKIKEFQDINKF